MIYELRQYIPVAGHEDAALRRFEEGIFEIFDRLGFKVVSFWVEDAPSRHLWYVLEWADRETMDAAYPAFRADAQWIELRDRTEVAGPILEQINTFILRDYPFPGGKPAA